MNVTELLHPILTEIGMGGASETAIMTSLAAVVLTSLVAFVLCRGGKKPKQVTVSASAAAAPKAGGENADAMYTLEELAKYDGVVEPKNPILICCLGTVFDMTKGKDFYGPGGPYEAFAGKDATVALAKMKVDATMCNVPDGVCGLTASEKDIVQDWYNKFEGKYPVMGKLVPYPKSSL